MQLRGEPPREMPADAAQFEDLTNWEDSDDYAGMRGPLSAYTADPYRGTQSALLENTDDVVFIRYTFSSSFDLSDVLPSIAVRSLNRAEIFVAIRVVDTNENILQTRAVHGDKEPGDLWTRKDFSYRTATSTPADLTDIDEIQIRAGKTSDAGEHRVVVDDLRFVPAGDTDYIMFTFDDGNETVYDNAFPVF